MAHAQAAANQQKHIDDFNRAVMIQRIQAQQRPQGPPMGMVSLFLLNIKRTLVLKGKNYYF